MGLLIEGVPNAVLAKHVLDLLDEGIVDVLVHVDPLDGTAALTTVKDSAIDDLLCCPCDIHIIPNVCRAFSTQLKADIHHPVHGGLLYSQTTGHRASEADVIHLWRLNESLDQGRSAAVEYLDHVLGKPGLCKCSSDLLHDRRGLRRGLEDHRVPSQKGWNQTVNQDQPGVLDKFERTFRQHQMYKKNMQ